MHACLGYESRIQYLRPFVILAVADWIRTIPKASVLYKIVGSNVLTGLFTTTCSLENVTSLSYISCTLEPRIRCVQCKITLNKEDIALTGLFTTTSTLENVTGLSYISCTLEVTHADTTKVQNNCYAPDPISLLFTMKRNVLSYLF